MYTHAHTYGYRHTRAHTHTDLSIHVCAHADLDTHRYTDTYIHRHTHTHIHAYAYAYACTPLGEGGEIGARTMCKLIRAFAGGVPASDGFNEAWLVVLPKASEAADTGGKCERAADCLRRLLLKNTGSNMVAATLARGMRPILSKAAHPTKRVVVAGHDLVRKVVELDRYVWAMHTTVMSDDLPVPLLCDNAAAFSSVSRRRLRAVLQRLGVPIAVIRVIDALNSGMLVMINQHGGL